MSRKQLLGAVSVFVSCSTLAWAEGTPRQAVVDALSGSGVKALDAVVEGAGLRVELDGQSVLAGLDDTRADTIGETVADAVAGFPEIRGIEVTIDGRPIWEYLPRVSELGLTPMPAASAAIAKPAGTLTNELAGKLAVLHPSHGSYWHEGYGYWFRAMRTYCGPNPATNIPPGWTGSTYQPSDHYYWTRGFQWGSFYEDDMSPETIRFLAKYLESSGAEVWVSRNLDKNAGDFDYAGYGYPNCSFPLPKWQTAAKYYLQDRGDVPESVWNTTDVTGQANIDIRARPYYANYRMTQKFPGQDDTLQSVWGNCASLSFHSNAAGSGTARGTETFWYTSLYPYLRKCGKCGTVTYFFRSYVPFSSLPCWPAV